MKPRLKKIKRDYLLLFLLVFLFFSFFRFYNLPKQIGFGWDEERDAFVIKKILVEKRLTLIGPRVLGPEGFFLGPYFTYLLTPFYFLTKLHPSATILFVVVYNLVFFLLAFLVLTRFFDLPTALIFLLIWALYPALIGIDKIAWNPLLVPLMVIAGWALLFKALKKPSRKTWFGAGILVGLGINFHFQLIFLFPFVLVFLLADKKAWLKKAISFLAGVILTFLPLAIFDLRHNFLNLKLLLGFLRSEEGGDYLAWLPVWRNIAVGLTGLDFSWLPAVFYLAVFILTLWTWRREKKPEFRLFFFAFSVLWFLFPLGFAFFGQRPSEYYFNFLYPFLVLLLAHFLLKILKNWWLVFLLVLLFSLPRINQLREGLKPNPLGLFYKEQVVQRVAEIGEGKKFNVSFAVPLGWDTGYRYLLDYYQVEQSGDMTDPLFQITIPPWKDSEIFGGIGLAIPSSFQPKQDKVE